MTRLQAVLLRLATHLDALGCKWALVGGVALAIRASPRTTRDVDVAIAVADDGEAERIVFELHHRGYRDRSEGVLVDSETGRLWTMRLIAPGDEAHGTVVDLLFASSGIEPEIVAAAEKLRIVEGLTVPVIRTGHLLAMKVLAARPQDLRDVQAILENIEPVEVDRARQALDLIARRGRDGERDLVGELEVLLERPREIH